MVFSLIDAAVWRASNSTFPKLLSKNWARQMMKTFEFEVISTIQPQNLENLMVWIEDWCFFNGFFTHRSSCVTRIKSHVPKKKCQKSNEKIGENQLFHRFSCLISRHTFFFRKNPSKVPCSPQRELSNGAFRVKNGAFFEKLENFAIVWRPREGVPMTRCGLKYMQLCYYQYAIASIVKHARSLLHGRDRWCVLHHDAYIRKKIYIFFLGK